MIYNFQLHLITLYTRINISSRSGDPWTKDKILNLSLWLGLGITGVTGMVHCDTKIGTKMDLCLINFKVLSVLLFIHFFRMSC